MTSDNPNPPTPSGPGADVHLPGHQGSVGIPPGCEWILDASKVQTHIREITRRVFPTYRGRKFRLEFRKTYRMQNYWDGGTRYFAVAVDLRSGASAHPDSGTTNPFNTAAQAEFMIPPGKGILELCIFCGKNLGIRLIVPPMTPKALGKEAGV